MHVVYRIPDQVKGALITPSAKHPGMLQITWFDDRGFWGDTERGTEAEAVKEVERDGYVPTEPMFFQQLTTTQAWADGMAAALEVARFNVQSFRRRETIASKVRRETQELFK